MKSSSLLFCASLLAFHATVGLHADQPSSPPAPTPLAQPQELKLVEQFDRNGDHLLDSAERQAARAYLTQHPPAIPTTPTGRIAAPPPPATALEPVKPGEKMSPTGVAIFPDKPLYDPETLRTLFLEFDDTDWEKQLTDFARTDVLVPARLTLDGKKYSGVGIHFHPPIALPAPAEGYKRSLELTLDATVAGQKINGQHQLQLLDASTDPTVLRTMLYSAVAGHYLPAPKANFVRVVINGESWGVYVSTQPLDENFLQQIFQTTAGARWTVLPGGNFSYLGDKADAYRGIYHLESPENPAAWTALIALCKALRDSSTNQLEAALATHLDIDSALRCLALENVLINQNGYGSSTGGYGLYLTTDGHFHLIPQESEASFRLVEISEYGNRSRRSGPPSNNPAPAADKRGPGETPTDKSPSNPAPRSNNPKDFPRQSGTDLAMLLSYSFVNKADSDFNEKITRDEWLTFARSWFLVMDEDIVGKITREQFLLKFRGLITPASIADGHTKQTYGRDDPAGIIGQDFFKAMDANGDNQLTSEEVINCFSQWFDRWSSSKPAVLTKAALQRGFTELFSRTVFQADQTYIAKHDLSISNDGTKEEPGRGKRDPNGYGVGGAVDVGPWRLGRGGRGGGESRTLITFSEELDPLSALDETNRPLLTKLLSVPVLRTRYLEYVRDISENWLNWNKLGPIAKRYHNLIAADVSKETHRATSYVHFVQELDQDPTPGSRDGDAAPSLKDFITERSAYLLKDDRVMGRSDGP